MAAIPRSKALAYKVDGVVWPRVTMITYFHNRALDSSPTILLMEPKQYSKLWFHVLGILSSVLLLLLLGQNTTLVSIKLNRLINRLGDISP